MNIVLLLCAILGSIVGCDKRRSHTQYISKQKVQKEQKKTVKKQQYVVSAENGLRIFTIQGAAHHSLFDGKTVENVQGIVTGITYAKNKPNGFYMQDKTGDGDSATSDGIYVFCGKHCPDMLAIGDEAAVTGMVQEYAATDRYGSAFLSTTQIVVHDKSGIKRISSGNMLPAPVVLNAENLEKPVFTGDLEHLAPSNEVIDFYESLEGMRVQVLYPRVVAHPHDGIYYIAPAEANGFSVRGGMMYNSYDSTARICMQPKRCFMSAAAAGIKNAVPVIGDSYTGPITGVLGYAQGNYQIEPTEPLPLLKRGYITPEQSKIRFNDKALNVVCYNLENFSYKDIKNQKGGVINHSSGKTAKERAQAFAQHFIHALQAPDVICLIEIQDDDSTDKSDAVQAKKTLKLLIDSMKMADPAKPYTACSIDPKKNADGGAPGANIRCAYLYRTDRLELVPDRNATNADSTHTAAFEVIENGKKLVQNPARIGVNSEAFKKTRKSLAAHFRFKKGLNGEKDFFIINNHFSSKQADGKIWGSIQPVERKSEARRHQQAKVVKNTIHELLQVRPQAAVISVGDYNDFWFSETIAIIKEAGMKNAVETLPLNDRYTYVYDGHSQTLDNILVSKNIDIMYADILHVNAEFSPKKRLSDHDPVFVQLTW